MSSDQNGSLPGISRFLGRTVLMDIMHMDLTLGNRADISTDNAPEKEFTEIVR